MKPKVSSYKSFLIYIILISLALFVVSTVVFVLFESFALNLRSSTQEASEPAALGNTSNPYLQLVNEDNPLPAEYEPENLVSDTYGETEIVLQSEANKYLAKMIEKASQDGVDLTVINGYRSYEDQEARSSGSVQEDGSIIIGMETEAPGTDDHQTGLAVDVSTEEIGNELRQDFAVTNAGRWIADNAEDFGFIIRFPKGKEEITGIMYEPWHLRFVGVSNARDITEKNLTLEEYVSKTPGQEVTDENSNDSNEGEQ